MRLRIRPRAFHRLSSCVTVKPHPQRPQRSLFKRVVRCGANSSYMGWGWGRGVVGAVCSLGQELTLG